MRIVVERGEAKFFDQKFPDGTIYVGRHADCQIVLPGDDRILARHLMIFTEDKQWLVEPLHDKFHTTHLNGHALHKRQALSDGDVITICEYKITVFTSETVKKKELLFQVIAKGHDELQETAGFGPEELQLPESVVVKLRNDTFSVSKGQLEYITGLTLKMLEAENVRYLMSLVLDALMKDFDACCAWIGLRSDSEGHLHLSGGHDLSGRSIDAPATARKISFAVVECARSIFQQSLADNPERSAIASPLVSPDGSLGMIYLESQPGKPRYTVADLDILVFICNQMALGVDRLLRLQNDQVNKFRTLDQELARKVQASTAPWQVPQWSGLQVSVLSEAGSGMTTDFYDIVPLGEEQAMVMIGQSAEGKSDTSISIAAASAAFRIGAVHRDMPQVLTRQLNWVLFTTASEPRELNLGILSINPKSGEFYICLSGMILAGLLTGSGKYTKIQTPNNPLVAQARKAKYEAVRGILKTGQTLALVTEGIFAVKSPSGETISPEHLWDVLSDSSEQVATRMMNDLIDDISAFSGTKRHEKDISVVLLKKT